MSGLRPDFSAARGKRLLIALSGGADSVALAVLLAEARQAYELTLFAAHVDHGIRPESGDDAAFCRVLCEALDIPFYLCAVDVPSAARQSGDGLETAARELRYRQLRRLQNETRSDYIALAHHLNDQAETVLMHLSRGAGLDGLRGMRELDEAAKLYRPLLNMRKSELTDCLRERGFGWREDATNRVADNPRNALRLNVIPEIERWYPRFAEAVSRCARTAQIEGDLMARLTAEYLHDHSADMPLCRWLEVVPLPHSAILRRAIRALCPEELDWEQVNALETLCCQTRGKIDIGAHYAERTGARLYFVPKRLPAIEPVKLSLDGETALFPLGKITASRWDAGPIRNDPLRQALNPASLVGAVLRTRQPGDRIRPLGGGDKLLSDYLIDKKVDRPLRDATPLVATGSRVHWVVGHGISQEAALMPGDKAILLTFEPMDGI